MAQTKSILAMSSFGLGAALLVMLVQIQRDPFAFTRLQAQSQQALTSVNLIAPAVELPAVVEEDLSVAEPAPLAPAPAKSRPKRSPPAQPIQSAEPPCNAEWRELESGPAGARVREICPPPGAQEIPRS